MSPQTISILCVHTIIVGVGSGDVVHKFIMNPNLQCTDVLIRVNTTSATSGTVALTLVDGAHNRTWQFGTQGVGVHEEALCMSDGEFTLTHRGGSSSWQGSVAVVGFIHYHNTITIPNDEKWIVQDIIDPATGLPASLDARRSCSRR